MASERADMVVWFRRDARLQDNAAWFEADGMKVCPLFVIDPRIYEKVSDRRRHQLLAGLADLDRNLGDRGGRLRVEWGEPAGVVRAVASSLHAEGVIVHREITPYGVERDALVEKQVPLNRVDGLYVHPPGSVRTRDGGTYKVFTAFHRTWSERPVPAAHADPDVRITADAGAGLPDHPSLPAGETSAARQFEEFEKVVDRYHEERGEPDATSRLSTALKYGWISSAHLVRSAGLSSEGRRAWVRQLAWRDFYAHLLDDNPSLATESMQPDFRSITWRNDPDDIRAWAHGRTGYPLVDAGMRQLAEEGWIHNRVRMVVASFLVKDLLVDWRMGERHFRRSLLDADVAQNAGNWQWVAGTGADAAPYFRVFNPVTQSRRFDPDGSYIRRWVPELDGLDVSSIHAPWEAKPLDLAAAGVVLGDTYPAPIVDHAFARSRAIETYEAARGSR